MSIGFQVLGEPARDNALLVRVESGQSLSRLLFDCGDGCLSGLSFSEIQAVDHLFFSHLHMDHVGGFDTFFRCNFERLSRANHIWGPDGTAKAMHHRFQGFWWNLIRGRSATWHVHDIDAETAVRGYRFELAEAFETRHDGELAAPGPIVATDDFTVEALPLPHHGLCLGYLVRERARRNIQMDKVRALGLQPGAWMGRLKKEETGSLDIAGRTFDIAELRRDLLAETPGESLAYLTDFLLDEPTFERLTDRLEGCDTVICESQYRRQDVDLALRNHHTTTDRVARLGAAAGFGRLILFHLSERYSEDERRELLAECRAIFEATSFPSHWKIDPAD